MIEVFPWSHILIRSSWVKSSHRLIWCIVYVVAARAVAAVVIVVATIAVIGAVVVAALHCRFINNIIH